MGRYKIAIDFDPFPKDKKRHKSILSNPIFLKLKDRVVDEEYKDIIKRLKDKEEKKIYKPKGTVDFMLKSYMRGDWDNYFRYQDLDKVILQYNHFKHKKNAKSISFFEK